MQFVQGSKKDLDCRLVLDMFGFDALLLQLQTSSCVVLHSSATTNHHLMILQGRHKSTMLADRLTFSLVVWYQKFELLGPSCLICLVTAALQVHVSDRMKM